jgi:hypothetical protein
MNDGFPSSAPTSFAPIAKSGNFTAILDRDFIVAASATVTDPTPAEGRGFSVFVRNGTATVGGVAYALAGTLIRRIYHSGAWVSKVTGTATEYATGGVYFGNSPADPGANNLTIQGTVNAPTHSSTMSGALATFNYQSASTWNSTAAAVIVGNFLGVFNISASATGATLSNQMVRLAYTKAAGAVSASTTAFTAGIDLAFTFNESESGGFTYGYNHSLSVAAGKTVGTLAAFNANPLSGSGSVTNLFSFRATTGAGASHLADGLYVGGTFAAPGAGNIVAEGNVSAGIFRSGITTDTTAGIINALSSTNGIARLTGAAPDLRGITAKAGAFVTVWFQNASTIRHAAGTAAAADRITTNTAADIAIAAGSSVQFFYDTTSAVWRPIRG